MPPDHLTVSLHLPSSPASPLRRHPRVAIGGRVARHPIRIQRQHAAERVHGQGQPSWAGPARHLVANSIRPSLIRPFQTAGPVSSILIFLRNIIPARPSLGLNHLKNHF